MATHIAITKTVGDLETRTPEHKDSHEHFPLSTEPFDSHEEASLAHPGKVIMSVEEYLGYKRAMNVTHGVIEAKRPWWKFWGSK